jgi:hypothetical protein
MTQARNNYARIIAKYKALGKGDVRLTESTLALIQPINAAKTSYLFPVLENENVNGLAPAVDEIRLNINDEFIVGSIGMYLYGSTAKSQGAIQRQIHTYAPNELNAVFNGVSDFYAGFLSVAVNKINYIDKWDSRKHQYVPRTQWANLGIVDTNKNYPATQADKKLDEHGVFNAQPNFTLSGAKKNEVSVNMPAAITPVSASWIDSNNETQLVTIDKMIIVFRGLLAQNAARFQ